MVQAPCLAGGGTGGGAGVRHGTGTVPGRRRYWWRRWVRHGTGTVPGRRRYWRRSRGPAWHRHRAWPAVVLASELGPAWHRHRAWPAAVLAAALGPAWHTRPGGWCPSLPESRGPPARTAVCLPCTAASTVTEPDTTWDAPCRTVRHGTRRVGLYDTERAVLDFTTRNAPCRTVRHGTRRVES